MPKMIKVSNFEEYTSHFPADIQERLLVLRKLVKDIAPDSIEVISYGMPCYKLDGNLGLFCGPKAPFWFVRDSQFHEAFKKELCGYKKGKGSVQFPYNVELPIETIKKMVRFKVRELKNRPFNPED